MSFTDGTLEIKTPGGLITATLNEESGWTCLDGETLDVLNRLFTYPNDLVDNRPQNPNPMLDLMELAAEALGGTVTQPPENTDPPGTVY